MSAASFADEVSCERQKYDPEFPATLVNEYQIIGRMPGSRAVYEGTLELQKGKAAYTLKRTVAGSTMTGEAWIEACGSDKFKMLNSKYTQGKKPMEGQCFMESNLENGMLLSCYTDFVGEQNEPYGLESLFPSN